MKKLFGTYVCVLENNTKVDLKEIWFYVVESSFGKR
jgi:hypothetical protein